MEDAPNDFAKALLPHEGPRLRAAFEACRDKGAHNYDRTTLNRWLAGSVPSNGEAVRCLSAELNDPAIAESWNALQKEPPPRGQPTADTVVRRFGILSEDDQAAAFQRIRQTFLGRFTSVRRDLTFRIEVLDPFNDDDDHFLFSSSLTWKGRILADTTVRLATDQKAMGDAYADHTCVFREKIEMREDRITQLLSRCDPPSLSIIPLVSTNPQAEIHFGAWDGLEARFGNDPAADAEIQLNIQYPVSRSTLLYPINFGQYRVEGGARVTLVLSSHALRDPQAVPFLPPGKERDITTIKPRSNTLEVRLGTHPDTMLSHGDGAVLGWGLV